MTIHRTRKGDQGNSGARPIRTCVIARHTLVRAYLWTLLSAQTNFQLFNFDALASNSDSRHDEIVFIVDHSDLSLPLREFVRQIRTRWNRAVFVLIADTLYTETLNMIVSATIEGFLPYQDVEESLVQAIRIVAEGGTWISAGILQQRASKLAGQQRPSHKIDSLTPREIEVYELLQKRLSNREIGEVLSLRQTTVKFHVSNVFSKFNVRCRKDLSVMASMEIWSGSEAIGCPPL